MSLINDALKKARQASQESAPQPPPTLELKALEPEQQVVRGIGIVLPIALAMMALLVLFLAWELLQRQQAPSNRGAAQDEMNVRALAPAPAPPSHPVETVTQEPSPKLPDLAPAVPGPNSVPLQATPSPAPARPTAPVNAGPATSPAPGPTVATQAVAAAVAPAPQPAPLRLQGVVYNPARPSAVINGKPLFIGERIGQYRVVAITSATATLVGAGKTNVLSLEQ